MKTNPSKKSFMAGGFLPKMKALKSRVDKHPKLAKTVIAVLCIIAVITVYLNWNSVKEDVVTFEAQKGTFEINIPLFGELDAAVSTPISTPPGLWGRQTVAYLVKENSFVKAGDTIIRLGDTIYSEVIKRENSNLSKLDLEIQDKEKNLEKEKKDFETQLALTEIEKKMAEVFQLKDETVFSRNEIISSAISKDFLIKKAQYLKRKKTQLEQKSKAELMLLQSRRQTIRMRIDQYQNAMNSLEIKAPHDGIFIYEKNQNGEKPQVGMTIWSGTKIGKLPDLKVMEAKIYVLESEAAGLKEKLPASITIDSSPGFIFHGTLKNIDTIAKPIEVNSPFKYFQAKLILKKTDGTIMKPGNQIKGFIYAKKLTDVLTVPNQAINFTDGQPYLSILSGKTIEKRNVKTGDRSLTRTVILSGLKPGEKVVF